MTIPNIFHFINIGPREFNMLHFISIYSAYTLNKPEKIYLYCDHEQKHNIYYEILKDVLTIEYITVPNDINGIRLESYQYKADVIRMTKLIERGGIYMDLDVISLKPLHKFLDNKIVLGSELSDDPDSININEFKSITNAVILTEPNNSFMKEWFKQMPYNIVGKPWAYHAVCLPKEILLNNPHYLNDIKLEPSKTFMPFCFRKPYIFNNDSIEMKTLLKESYTMHLWETIWYNEYISKFSVQYFLENNNIFTDICKQYIKVIYDTNKLDVLIDKLYVEEPNGNKLKLYREMRKNLLELFG